MEKKFALSESSVSFSDYNSVWWLDCACSIHLMARIPPGVANVDFEHPSFRHRVWDCDTNGLFPILFEYDFYVQSGYKDL